MLLKLSEFSGRWGPKVCTFGDRCILGGGLKTFNCERMRTNRIPNKEYYEHRRPRLHILCTTELAWLYGYLLLGCTLSANAHYTDVKQFKFPPKCGASLKTKLNCYNKHFCVVITKIVALNGSYTVLATCTLISTFILVNMWNMVFHIREESRL
jgi:hypothetical protein